MTRTICFIGGGNMAFSLVSGLLKADAGASLRIADPLPSQRERFDDLGVISFEHNDEAIDAADIIVLAVKPQIAQQVLEPLKIRPEQLLVSIAAGIDSESLKLWTSDTQPIVRCMPNTPALLGAGMTALYANEYCDNDHQQTANTILSSAGKTVWVDQESKLDAVTAVSGSGPAYFFALMEAMVEAGVSLGLDREMATQLTLQTGVGAALMADRTDDNPATLRANVTSPGGTTEAALTVMRDAGFNEIMRDALDAAARRSQTLAREFGGKI